MSAIKPAPLRILQGNPGHRPIKVEPTPKATRPACPAHLSAEAKKVWKRIIPEIEHMKLLTSADRDSLAVYCVAVARWTEAVILIDRSGILLKGARGEMVKNPACLIERENGRTIQRMAAEFALTPAARARIAVPDRADDVIARRYLSA